MNKLRICIGLATTLLLVSSIAQSASGLTASVSTQNGVSRLIINNKPTLPFVFFYNTHQSTGYIERFQNPQVVLSAIAGVHIYSMLIPTSFIPNGKDFTGLNEIMQSFVDKDSKALFILRIWPGPNPSWPEWKDIPNEETMLYADGTRGPISLASDYYWKLSNRGLSELIRYVEDGPYGNRIVGYHVGGPEFEMFPYQFREKGPDVSRPSQVRFRQWLIARYGSDAKLQKAWANRAIRLDTAEVPVGEPGRFPMHYQGPGKMINVFYSLPRERAWVDYSEYVSELAISRLQDWAKLIKRETNRKKLSIFCYGYTSELIGSFGAHSALQKLMKSPDVDVLMSPVPYYGRTVGEPAGFMSPVDSIPLHKKLWLNEDDIRTNLVDQTAVPSWLVDDLFGVRSQSTQTTINLLDRNFGNLLVHRAATWWMDLSGAGAFNDPAPWAMLKKRLPMYQDVYNNPKPYRPEVAVILDEHSKLYVKSDWDAFFWSLIDLRNQCGRSGASVGYYTLQDFITGLVPKCKLYLFPNTFAVTPEQTSLINARLDREKATAIWHYASGCLNGNAIDARQSSRLTGIFLRQLNGKQNSIGEGLLKGLKWAPDLTLKPRLVIADKAAKIVGHYPDGKPSAAIKRTGQHTSIYLGSLGLTSQLLTKLFTNAGVHTWTRDGSVVQTDGQWLMIHTDKPGPKSIYLPLGIKAKPLTGSIVKQSGQIITANFIKGDTRWFKLSAK